MKFHADQPLNNSVEAIGDGWVQIAGQRHSSSLVLTHTGTCEAWHLSSLEQLQDTDLAALNTKGIELVLLGTGRRHRVVHPKHTHPLIARGVGLECMSSAAACRTYNVLISEGRQVLLALILEAAD